MVNHALASGRPTGLAGTREFLETMGRQQMTHEGWSELDVVAEADFVVQYGARLGRWHGGRFMGIETPAGAYNRAFAAMYRFEGGRIAERWAVRDDTPWPRRTSPEPPSSSSSPSRTCVRPARRQRCRAWLDALHRGVFANRPLLTLGLVGAHLATGDTEGVEALLDDIEGWLDPNARSGEVIVHDHAEFHRRWPPDPTERARRG